MELGLTRTHWSTEVKEGGIGLAGFIILFLSFHATSLCIPCICTHINRHRHLFVYLLLYV